MNNRIIKKYPNRRLYDTQRSSYITLDDVANLIFDEVPFEVVDSKTKKDLTHLTLLQILFELEEKESSLLSDQVILTLIRAYSNSTKDSIKIKLTEALKTVELQSGHDAILRKESVS